MNNLKRIMELKKLDAIQLAKISGISVSNIRRILSDPQITPYKGTADILATALSVTPAQIYGVQPAALKDGELFAQRACDAAEALVRALRDYTEKPATLGLVIKTREDHGNGKDCYSFTVITSEKRIQKTVLLKFDETGELIFANYDNDERRPE